MEWKCGDVGDVEGALADAWSIGPGRTMHAIIKQSHNITRFWQVGQTSLL